MAGAYELTIGSEKEDETNHSNGYLTWKTV